MFATLIWFLLPLSCDDYTVCEGGRCGQSDDSSDASEDTDTGQSDDSNTVDPEWTADEAAGRMESVLTVGLAEPLLVRSLYVDFMSTREQSCPAMEDVKADGYVGVWMDDCTTEEGTHFYGTAIYEEETEDLEEDGFIMALAMVASFELTDVDGEVFVAGGEFTYQLEQDGQGTAAYSSMLGGTYQYPADEGWVRDGTEVATFMEGTWSEKGGELTIDGGVGYILTEGDGSESTLDVYFHSTLFDSDACDGQPQGEVSIRDPSKLWYTYVFTECSSCATAYWQGEALEEVCFSDILAEAALDTMAVMGEGPVMGEGL